MHFLKRSLTILFIVAFTQANSQEIVGEKIQFDNHANDNASHITIVQLDDVAREGSQLETSTDDENTAGIEFLAPALNAKYKRGDMIQVRWTGGNADDEYALDLFDGRFHYKHIGELKNSGTYPWIIPGDVEPGDEYKFKLTNTEDFGEFAFSETFIIKRKVPLAAWIVPGALVVGGGLFLLLYDNSPEELPDLPRPIEPN